MNRRKGLTVFAKTSYPPHFLSRVETVHSKTSVAAFPRNARASHKS